MVMDINAENRKILVKRAAALAKEESADDNRPTLEVTSFYLGNERYAVETFLIKEVIALDGITPLPCVPPFIAGIMNVRGRILSLVNLRRLLELAGEIPDGAGVIVLAAGDMEFGLVVDAVEGVINIPADEVHASIPAVDESRSAYFRGITADRMMILNGEGILNDPRLVIHESVL